MGAPYQICWALSLYEFLLKDTMKSVDWGLIDSDQDFLCFAFLDVEDECWMNAN